MSNTCLLATSTLEASLQTLQENLTAVRGIQCADSHVVTGNSVEGKLLCSTEPLAALREEFKEVTRGYTDEISSLTSAMNAQKGELSSQQAASADYLNTLIAKRAKIADLQHVHNDVHALNESLTDQVDNILRSM